MSGVSEEEALSKRQKSSNDELDPVYCDEFTDEEWDICNQSIEDSDGFTVIIPRKAYIMDGIYPITGQRFKNYRNQYEFWCKYAIDEYNESNKKNLEFVNVFKVNEEYGAGTRYYFTLLAQDKNANNAKLICEAKVWDGMHDCKELELFRVKN